MEKYPVVSETGREYEVRIIESNYWAHPDLSVKLFSYRKGIFGRNRRILINERDFSDVDFGERFECDYINLAKYCVKKYEEEEYYPWVRFEDWDGKC